MVSQIEELERRVRENDTNSFELEVRLGKLEDINEQLKELVLTKQVEIDSLNSQLTEEREEKDQLRRRAKEELSLSEKKAVRPVRERIVFMPRDNQKVSKLSAWKFQQKFPLTRLLILVSPSAHPLVSSRLIDGPHLLPSLFLPIDRSRACSWWCGCCCSPAPICT